MSRIAAPLLLIALSFVGSAQTQQNFEVQEVQNDYLLLNTYQLKEVKKVELPDVVVSQDIVGKGNPLRFIYSSEPDFQEELLKAGLAELKNPATASQKYIDAQEAAIRARKGIWAKRLPQQNSNTTSPVGAEQNSTSLWDVIVFLSTLGFISILITLGGFLIKRLLFRRPIHLLLLGEMSAGKTAISERILNPNVARTNLEELIPTQATIRKKKRAGIPYGEYIITPHIEDIPGKLYGDVLDALIQNRFVPPAVWKALTQIRLVSPRVWLFVVAPIRDKEIQDSQSSVDKDYVNIQLGILKAQVRGGLDADTTIKPIAVILFMNKFDLFCQNKPDDKAADQARREFEGIFFEHKQAITEVINRRGNDVKFYPIVGSAYHSWSYTLIIDSIGHAL